MIFVDDATGAAIHEEAGPSSHETALDTPEAASAPSSGSFVLTVHGLPEPKARPRAAVVGGRARLYTPSKTARYEDRVRKTALRDWRHDPLRGAAITLVAAFYLSIPESWPAWRRDAATAGAIVPTGRPDLDNLVKAILDGMNGTVYLDDSAIVSKRVEKRYDSRPRVEIALLWRSMPATRAEWEATR